MSEETARREIGKLISGIEATCVATGGVSEGVQLSGPMALLALKDLEEEFARLKQVEQTYEAAKPQLETLDALKSKIEPTTKVERFEDSLTILAGGERPDRALVEAWFDEEKEKDHIKLQEWAVNNTGLGWAMGIGVIDAALTMADNPDEGVDHQF